MTSNRAPQGAMVQAAQEKQDNDRQNLRSSAKTSPTMALDWIVADAVCGDRHLVI
jgi:hypothetical protein